MSICQVRFRTTAIGWRLPCKDVCRAAIVAPGHFAAGRPRRPGGDPSGGNIRPMAGRKVSRAAAIGRAGPCRGQDDRRLVVRQCTLGVVCSDLYRAGKAAKDRPRSRWDFQRLRLPPYPWRMQVQLIAKRCGWHRQEPVGLTDRWPAQAGRDGITFCGIRRGPAAGDARESAAAPALAASAAGHPCRLRAGHGRQSHGTSLLTK